MEALAKQSREQNLQQRQEDLEMKQLTEPQVTIAGLPPHLPLRKDGSNLWGAMEKMVMRDGRIYDLQSVLAKISEIGFAENP